MKGVLSKSKLVSANVKALIIPGNPPSNYFYNLWRSELLDLNLFDEILYESYPQFEKSEPWDYLNMCVEFYANIIRRSGGEFVLIGHSLGGYIATELAKKDLKIHYTFLLFPFLGNPGNWGKIILKFASILSKSLTGNQICSLKSALGYLNQDLKKITSHELLSSLTMAYYEEKTLGRLVSVKSLKNIGPFSYFYTNSDTWSQKTDGLKADPQSSLFCPDFSHDFIRYKDERLKMNQKIQIIWHKFLAKM